MDGWRDGRTDAWARMDVRVYMCGSMCVCMCRCVRVCTYMNTGLKSSELALQGASESFQMSYFTSLLMLLALRDCVC